jgi:hypothetical protein
VKQYFVDEYARVLISVNQRIKLLSTVIRDIVLFRPEMKIKTRHHILPTHTHAMHQRLALNSEEPLSSDELCLSKFEQILPIVLALGSKPFKKLRLGEARSVAKRPKWTAEPRQNARAYTCTMLAPLRVGPCATGIWNGISR